MSLENRILVRVFNNMAHCILFYKGQEQKFTISNRMFSNGMCGENAQIKITDLGLLMEFKNVNPKALTFLLKTIKKYTIPYPSL